MKTIKKILVIGGAGFIGSHLCQALVRTLNNEVTSLDNYTSGSIDNHVEGVKYINGDAKDIFTILDFVPDLIFHFGEYSRVENSYENIEQVVSSNVIGTANVLEYVRIKKCKLVYSGSSTKFADGEQGSSSSPYAWTKAKNTELVKNYGEWFGLKYAITYFYNVYGVREVSEGDYATLIGLFTNKMRVGAPLTVVSPGTQSRNFTNVKDIIEALLLIGEKGEGDGYGIGHPNSYTVLQVAELFNGKIEMLPERKGNRQSSLLVTSKTQDLGWNCKHDLPTYIQGLKMRNWLTE
ncbi:NAD-dependent epimerase/dehydratase family protein [Planktomarina temperata]|nr:NAD-dependent epimerase/dehydratase family protein [Planktomarina temperata]